MTAYLLRLFCSTENAEILKSGKINSLPGALCFGFEFFVGERLDWAPGPSFLSAKPKEIPQREAEACGPAFSHGKITASWFREARRCPRAPAAASKYPTPY
jgi:hypothetical protein